MSFKNLIKAIGNGIKEYKALKSAGEMAEQSAKLSRQEAVVLERGLTNNKNFGRIGDEVELLSARAASTRIAQSKLAHPESIYSMQDMGSVSSLTTGNVYRATTSDIIKIGNTELSLSDPRILEALERKGIGKFITVGRKDCDVIINDSAVSAEHLVIRAKYPGSKRLYIEDIGSTNGTHVRKTSKYTQADRTKDGDGYVQYMRSKANPEEIIAEPVRDADDVIAKVVRKPQKAHKKPQRQKEEVLPKPVREYDDVIAESVAESQRIAAENDRIIQEAAYYSTLGDDLIGYVDDFGHIL